MKNSGYLKATMYGMALNGVWVPNFLEKSIYRIPFYIYAFSYQLFMFFVPLLLQFLHLIQFLGNLEKMADIAILFLTYVAQLMKVVYIWTRQARIKRLIQELDGPDCYPKEASKIAVLDAIGQWAYRASKITIISSFFTGMMLGVIPFLKPKLTLPLGYPDIPTNSSWFKPLYAYETLCISLNAVGDAAEDFIAGGLMVLVSAQLQLLSDQLIRIAESQYADYKIEAHRRLKEKKGKLVENISTIVLTTPKYKSNYAGPSDAEIYKKAVSCAKLHQTIIRITEELNNIFSVPVSCQFAASLFIICTTALKITNSREPIELLTMTSYLICILVELLVYCFSGNFIIYKSQEVSIATYSSGWVRTSPKTRKCLHMIMLRAQKPLSVSAGKIFNLSLVTLTVILKTSYSFFAVLNQTQRS